MISRQPSLLEYGTPLDQVEFVVFDLETTGGSSQNAEITEIGAVKVRGGEVLGEFSTLVRPNQEIPPFITALTGISPAMVADAPAITNVLPSFLEFIRGSILVAHNARFDMSFIVANCKSLGYDLPRNAVVDTLTLARRLLSRSEIANHKLGTLAHYFKVSQQPNHRALADAQATVEIFHALLERLANFGVSYDADLLNLSSGPSQKVRAKSKLAERLPEAPGVYLFKDGSGEILYIGSSLNLKHRVRSYFTRAETRRHITHMVEFAQRVDHYECPTHLEAQVLELRLLQQHQPRYNRRDKVDRRVFLQLSQEPHPKLALNSELKSGRSGLGPISKRKATMAASLIEDFLRIRNCRARLPATPKLPHSACVRKDLGSCAAPCADFAHNYKADVAAVEQVFAGDFEVLITRVKEKLSAHIQSERFEAAQEIRDGVAALLEGYLRLQQLTAVRNINVVFAKQVKPDQWEVFASAYGRLESSATLPSWLEVQQFAQDFTANPPLELGEAASNAEVGLITRELYSGEHTLVALAGEWHSPYPGIANYRQWLLAAHTEQTELTQLRISHFT